MSDEFSSFVMSETTINQIKALPENLQLKYFLAVANYGISGTEPDFIGLELAVWVSMRDFIQYTKRKDEKWRQKQRENGLKGGRPKTQVNPNKPTETQDNPNDILDNVITHNDNSNENININENGSSSNAPEKPPPISVAKNNKCKITNYGFTYDEYALTTLILQTDTEWFDGEYSFIDFVVEILQKDYGDKTAREKNKIFRKLLFDAPNLREEYPSWRDKRVKAEKKKAREMAVDVAKSKHPTKCIHCKKDLVEYDGNFHCRDCAVVCSLKKDTLVWEWEKF